MEPSPESCSQGEPFQKITGFIRVKTICLFRDGSKILVSQWHDPATSEPFYCPLGGGIEFGEHSRQAVEREIYEEIGEQVVDLELLGVLENQFTFGDEPGHEIVFVYDGRLRNTALYQQQKIRASEGTQDFEAFWLDLNSLSFESPRLCPDGLQSFLERLAD